MKESQLQKQCIDFCRAHGVFGWRMPLGPIVHTIGQRQFWRANPLKGFPDYAGVLQRTHRGCLFAFEFKSDKGRLKPEQVEWRKKLQDAGAFYAEIRSLDDLTLHLRLWGEID